MNGNKAVFLDRDGTLIEDKNYAYLIEDLEILPGVIEGLKDLQKNFKFFIVTNIRDWKRILYRQRFPEL